MERKKASDYPQELLNLFDIYVHGGIDRRALARAAGVGVVGAGNFGRDGARRGDASGTDPAGAGGQRVRVAVALLVLLARAAQAGQVGADGRGRVHRRNVKSEPGPRQLQYCGTVGSMTSDQSSIPPASESASVNPALRRIATALKDRMPWWQ